MYDYFTLLFISEFLFLQRKMVSEMTYNVSSRTLNPTVPLATEQPITCIFLTCYTKNFSHKCLPVTIRYVNAISTSMVNVVIEL